MVIGLTPSLAVSADDDDLVLHAVGGGLEKFVDLPGELCPTVGTVVKETEAFGELEHHGEYKNEVVFVEAGVQDQQDRALDGSCRARRNLGQSATTKSASSTVLQSVSQTEKWLTG